MNRLGYLRSVDLWEKAEGSPAPFGATWVESERAWNFALFSRHATSITLLLYGEEGSPAPVFQLALDRVGNKTGPIWHCFVLESAAPDAQYYGYRIDGPHDPAHGHLFDPQKVLLDPFVRAVHFPKDFSREAARKPGSNESRAPLGVLPRGAETFEWGNRAPPRHTHDTIIYELHVKGFTARHNSGVSLENRGTFLGLIEKIPYLKELGITVVELLPVHQLDPQEGNYWGYMTLNFFAPHRATGYVSHCANFSKWCGRFKTPAWKYGWTSSITILRKGTKMGPLIRCEGWTTPLIICGNLMAITATTAAAATPPVAPTRLHGPSCSAACGIGPRTCMSMASVSTSRPSWRATSMAVWTRPCRL